MSWDTYRDSMTAGGFVNQASIIGLTDKSIWTKSDGFEVTTSEIDMLLKGFGDGGVLAANGVRVAGVKYFFLRCIDDQIEAKKGTTGVSIAKCKQCMVIGTYPDGVNPGSAAKSVGDIADHLRTAGY